MRTILELEPREHRVLGSLMEKEQTTPEYYPMTLKGLVAACNQKTNRDPVMALGELEVLNVLRVLLQEDLVERSFGARADRWGHRIDQSLHFKGDWKAVVTLLLLRGPQTPGELRGRADRLHPFETLEEVDQTLRELASESPPLVVEVPRRPGQKETRWALNVEGVTEGVLEDWTAPPVVPAGPDRGTDLQERLAQLEETVGRLEEELAQIKERLGIAAPSPVPSDVGGPGDLE